MTVSACAETVRPVRRAAGAEFVRYFACSAAALGADLSLYASALGLGLSYPVAAAIGFTCGLWLAYQLSIRYAFAARRVADKGVEFALFAAIGLAGLLLTEGLLWMLIGAAGWSPLPAKTAVAACVFCFNFGSRKLLLFTVRA